MVIDPDRVCPNELIAFAKKVDSGIEVRFRSDYDTLFVDAKYWLQYCKAKAVLNKLAFSDIGMPITLITESPHVDEFFEGALLCYKGGVTYCRPVNGKSYGTAGFLLRQWLPIVLDNVGAIADDMWHPIIIVNACPYQCSEGLPTNAGPRDENFLKLFLGCDNTLNHAYLVKCIKQYNPCKVIEACTKGDARFIKKRLETNYSSVCKKILEKSLRGCVEYALCQSGILFESVCHPCSWYNSKCRRPRKVKKSSRSHEVDFALQCSI